MGLQHKTLRAAMKGALRLIYPPQCLSCGAGVGEEGALCPDCWREAHFIAGCACGRCGAPLPDDGTGTGTGHGGTLCDDCMVTARPWRQGRAAMVYAGTGRKLVLALKHGDRADLAPALAGFMVPATTTLTRPDMIVAPVPIHWRRMMKRKYNQAELLSSALATRLGLPHAPDLLRRIRATEAQDHRSVADRFDNVQGVIAINPRVMDRLRGRAVLLVDDVMTSGATLAACADALRGAGSGPVSVSVLARAVRND